MRKQPQESSEELFGIQDAQTSKAQKELGKRYKICGALLGILVLSLILTFLGVHYFWNPPPHKYTFRSGDKRKIGEREREPHTQPSSPWEKITKDKSNIYGMEHSFVSQGERQKILMKLDPVSKTEIFQTGKGSDEVLEIHDFKNGISGIFFVGDPKCFLRSQMKGIPPEMANVEAEEPESEEVTTYIEQSVVWVRGEKAIESKDFLENSKIFDLCKNVTTYWIHPTLLTEPEPLDFDSEGEADDRFHANRPGQEEIEEKHWAKQARPSPRRQARQLTEQDLPVNDYTENGLEFHPMWDERGYCCARCRRAHRYCRRICEPLLGYYPYPYCYQGGRVICRVIMPCNWWIARMLGRV